MFQNPTSLLVLKMAVIHFGKCQLKRASTFRIKPTCNIDTFGKSKSRDLRYICVNILVTEKSLFLIKTAYFYVGILNILLLPVRQEMSKISTAHFFRRDSESSNCYILHHFPTLIFRLQQIFNIISKMYKNFDYLLLYIFFLLLNVS